VATNVHMLNSETEFLNGIIAPFAPSG
jgi:hypothetical protein